MIVKAYDETTDRNKNTTERKGKISLMECIIETVREYIIYYFQMNFWWVNYYLCGFIKSL